MKMQTTIYALTDSGVDAVKVQTGDPVNSKYLLIRFRVIFISSLSSRLE